MYRLSILSPVSLYRKFRGAGRPREPTRGGGWRVPFSPGTSLAQVTMTRASDNGLCPLCRVLLANQFLNSQAEPHVHPLRSRHAIVLQKNPRVSSDVRYAAAYGLVRRSSGLAFVTDALLLLSSCSYRPFDGSPSGWRHVEELRPADYPSLKIYIWVITRIIFSYVQC